MFDKNERNINIGGKVLQSNINVADGVTQTLNVSQTTSNEQPLEIINRIQTLIDQAVKLDENIKSEAIQAITKIKTAIEHKKSISIPVSTLLGVAEEINGTGDSPLAQRVKTETELVVSAYK